MSEHSDLVAIAQRRADDLAADEYRTDAWLIHKLADVVEAYDKRAQEQPVSNHAELLTEARDYATGLVPAMSIPGTPTEAFRKASAQTLRDLADTVEAQDQRIAQLTYTNADVAALKAVAAELVAACVTCDERIMNALNFMAYRYVRSEYAGGVWIELRAAGHLAHVAVENWEKASVAETMDRAIAEHGELLERLADTNQPPEQPAPPVANPWCRPEWVAAER